MNTVKHLRSSSSPPWRKTLSLYWSKTLFGYFPAIVSGTLLGTYLDLLLVGNQMYSFPVRLLSEIFPINIAFNLLGVPLLIIFFLYITEKLDGGWKVTFILILSLMMSLFEVLAEKWGLFTHSSEWRHYYTFIGYILFLLMVLSIQHWTYRSMNE